jgi:hypothetical protein
MPINFDSYKYFPALRTRPAEIDGYAHLNDQIKDSLSPIITLGAWPRSEGLEESIRATIGAIGDRPLILDLTREASYQNAAVKSLLDPQGAFERWREFAARVEKAIPVVQITSDAKLAQIIKQARLLEKSSSKAVAFKIADFASDTSRVVAALSALDAPGQALVIVDAGYIRDSMSASLAAVASAINEIRDEIPDAIITVTSTSFPASVVGHLTQDSAGTNGTIAILERDLHSAIGPDAAIYGDHSSIHSRVYIAAGGRFMPRIDYPLSDAWQFERRPGKDSTGYIDAAKTHLRNFPAIEEEDTWGAEKIRNASRGDIEGMKTPARWIAARVNMHISRQQNLSNEYENSEDDDFGLD